MIYTKNMPVLFRFLFLFVVLFLTTTPINAQTIGIDTEDRAVSLGGTGTYYLDMSSPTDFADFRWEIYPYDVSEFVGGAPNNKATMTQIFWKKPGTHQIKVSYYDRTRGQTYLSYDVYVSASADMTDAITIVSNCKSVVLDRKDPPTGVTYYWQSTANGTSTDNSVKTRTLNNGTEYFLRAKIDSNDIWSAASASVQYQINPNAYLTWYLDADQDGLGNPNYYVQQCTNPSTHNVKYVLNNTDTSDGDANFISDDFNLPNSDKEYHWTHEITYSVEGRLTGVSRTYFDDLGKPDVSLSKDMVSKRVWGTETSYDKFGRPDKTSFIAPSNLFTLNKVSFLNSTFQAPHAPTIPNIPANKNVGNITTSQTIQVTNNITASGVISPGLNITFIGNDIVLEDGFSVNGASGGVFTATAKILSANSNETFSGSPFFSYYSDNNTLEPYQATASQPYTQTNYDTLNPENVINVVGGNKINNEWKTGYSYTVPAAQEMYYIYGSDYYDGIVTAKGEEVITKFYKTVNVDANGVENVAFTDGEGKILATAQSGGAVSYPVVSLIGTQGFVDVHIPAGTTSPSLLGLSYMDPSTGRYVYKNASDEYKIYDLKTGEIVSTPLTGGHAYRIEAISPPTADPKVYISNGVPTYEANVLGISYNVNYYDYALNIYNETGELTKSIQPNGYVANATIVGTPAHMSSDNFASTFQYDALGQLIEKTSPDEGTSRFEYRNDGQISFSQSALQAQNTKVSYTKYDDFARPVTSGVVHTTWNSRSEEFDAVAHTEQTFTVYDHPVNYSQFVEELPSNLTLSSVLSTAGILSTDYIQNNLSGNVAITYSKPASIVTAITWYSYDIYGRAEWIVQYNQGIGAKTIHYQYDAVGNIKKVLFQKDKDTERFVHQYSYDANDVLTKVETSIDNASFITHADYSYYQTGELKRVDIAQGTQGIDYVYTLGGQLKSINHPSLEAAKDPGGDSNDVFGLTLDYYNGDYLRTGKNIASSPTIGTDYNGNIKAARWTNKAIPDDYSGGTANPKAYLYNYNRNNWLTEAIYGTTVPNTTQIAPTAAWAEKGITYDPNGNIKALQRTNTGGNLQDDLTYNYYTGKNQLKKVADAIVNSTGPDDLANQATPENYQYDDIGQMIRNNQENIDYIYNTQGLIKEVSQNGHLLVRFSYNERGQRIKKERFKTSSAYTLDNTEYYILDLSGNTMAVYNQPSGSAIAQKDLPIFGLSRLGVYNRTDAVSSYEITDHLGNVRSVIQKLNGNPDVKSFADYYPFGERLPDRNSLNYRYAFQGQELDTETNMEAFQLRLWDGRIGRWLSPDPMGQYSSPYLGMGNNPVNGLDPNGGFWEELGNFFSGNGWVKNSEMYTNITEGNSRPYNSYYSSSVQDAPTQFVGSFYDSTYFYEQVSVNTMLIGKRNNPNVKTFGLILPQNFGNWNETGSDGLYWVGCLSCHADNGAFRYAAYNSAERQVGLVLGTLLEAAAFRVASFRPRVRFDVTKTYMDPKQMSIFIRELEAGYKNGGTKLLKSHVLTSDQVKALSENLKQTLTKTIPNANTNSAIINQLYNPRWRYIDQIPGGRKEINKAIKGTNIFFPY
ncbi:RHS repeat domain-containing protein [Flavobacterium limi]|uniref:RHS repeat domain-containing protein n=1 Tax=Flavobacterium limi TaxID=2045105 RepID=UPI0013D04002|nr:RHS repeat-associated core domain-containing protein [Flavobacterium limi]